MNGEMPKEMTIIRALCLSTFMVGLDTLVVTPLLPTIMETMGEPAYQGSLLVTVYAGFSALGALLLGMLSDLWGRRTVIWLGLGVLGGGTVLSALAPSFFLLMISRGIAGIGAALILPTVFALIGDLVSFSERGRAHGKAMGAMIAATVLGVPLGALLASLFSWRITFALIAMAVFSVQVLIGRVLAKGNQTSSGKSLTLGSYFRHFGMAFSSLSLIFGFLVSFLWSGGFNAMFANIGIFYKTIFGLDLRSIGAVMLAGGLATWGGSLLGGRLSDRWGKKNLLAGAAGLAALSVFLLGHSQTVLWSAIALYMLWGLAMGMGAPCLIALISQLKPEARGMVMSMNSCLSQLGIVAGTGFSSWALHRHGFAVLSAFSALCLMFVPPLLFFFVRLSKASLPVSSPIVSTKIEHIRR